MSVMGTLLRKQFIESRWTIGLSAAAFCGLSVLFSWRTKALMASLESGELGPRQRGSMGMLRFMGGPEMDFSTTAIEVLRYNHPVIMLTVLAWVVARGATAVAGEIERGTVDVTLSRPVSRSTYLSAQILFSILGLLIMVGALMGGTLLGGSIYALKSPPSFVTLLKPSLMLLGLGLAVYGYTIPFSAYDVVRWRPMMASTAITLAGLTSLMLAGQFPDYEKTLQRASVFFAYTPVTVAMKTDPLAYNMAVLIGIFAAGVALSFVLFLRRDIPSNS